MSEVRLEPWEREWSEHVGTRRHQARLTTRNAEHYDDSRMEDDLRADIAGACAELAVAKRLNRYWNGSYWTAQQHSKYLNGADVGANTEVRRIRERHHKLQVRTTDVERNRIMVLAYPVPNDFTVVEVVGYGWANQLWEVGDIASFDKTGTVRLVRQDSLYPL
jgi:hypothetical protein